MSSSAKPPPRAMLYVYPWDLRDEGVDRALDTIAGCGIDGIQLAFSYHVASFLHPRNPQQRVNDGERGALHFVPISTDQWPFPPPVSRHVDGPRYLSNLLEAASARGLHTTAWVVFLYNHAVARAQPELAVVNAFGDTSGSQLCPANPTVRTYCRSLTGGVLAHAPLDGFVAESLSYLTYPYGLMNLKAAVELDRPTRTLLGLCFCAACQERARREGVAVAELRRAVRDAVDATLARLPDGAPTRVDGPDVPAALRDDLAAFHAVRRRAATSLLLEVLALAGDAGLRIGTTVVDEDDADATGISSAEVLGTLDEFRIEVEPTTEPQHLRARVDGVRSLLAPSAPIYALVQLGKYRSEREFQRALEVIHGVGLKHVRLYQYGLLTTRQLAWLRNASGLWSDVSARA